MKRAVGLSACTDPRCAGASMDKSMLVEWAIVMVIGNQRGVIVIHLIVLISNCIFFESMSAQGNL